jgi:hypothetical protein
MVIPCNDDATRMSSLEDWSLTYPTPAWLPPCDDIEPIGTDTIDQLFKCSSLNTVLFGDAVISEPMPDPSQWQKHGIIGTTITRYMGDGQNHLLVLRNLSRSECRGCWSPFMAGDDDTENWQEYSQHQLILRTDGSGGERRSGYREAGYRWRTAMAYGQYSIPTWLGMTLLSALGTTFVDLAIGRNQAMSAAASRILTIWESGDRPWNEPGWWKYATGTA